MSTKIEAMAAQQKVARRLRRNRLVNGVGLIRVPDGWAIRVNLLDALPDDGGIPSEVDGIPVTTNVVGHIRTRVSA